LQDNHWHGYQNVNAEALTLSIYRASNNERFFQQPDGGWGPQKKTKNQDLPVLWRSQLALQIQNHWNAAEGSQKNEKGRFTDHEPRGREAAQGLGYRSGRRVVIRCFDAILTGFLRQNP
jgi:hypothetical protein